MIHVLIAEVDGITSKLRANGNRALCNCRIPDDWIDTKRYALFTARSVMSELIEQLKASSVVSQLSAS